MNNNYAVIFASYIPNENYLWVGIDMLEKIKAYLPGADIYAGINPSIYTDKWIEILNKYTNIYEITPDNLTVKSDASAYQTALKLYYINNKKYDLVWFVHTQGTKSGRHHLREAHLQKILVSADYVIDFFNSNNFYGGYTSCYSPAPWIHDTNIVPIETILNSFIDFKFSCFRYITNGTTYVIRGEILNNFLNNCKDSFFNGHLISSNSINKTDLYFFERDFMQIVPRSGFMVGSGTFSNDYNINADNLYNFYKENLNKWKKDNNLLYD